MQRSGISNGCQCGPTRKSVLVLGLDQLDIVRGEMWISCKEVHTFMLCLGDQHAVEWIAVVERKGGGLKEMTLSHWQDLEPGILDRNKCGG